MLIIQGAHILEHDRVADVAIAQGSITAVATRLEPKPGDRLVDGSGKMLIPGYIDIHVHGAGDADVFDGDLVALETLSRTLAQLGTTAFLATTMVRPGNNDHIRLIADCLSRNLGGARLLGLHLEGPFISQEKRGGILTNSIYSYTPTALDELLELCGKSLRMMTMAPELPDCRQLVQQLKSRSVIPALGHSNCTYEEAKTAFDWGVRHITHLFNAMPGLHHRFPGPIVAALEDERVTAQLICDGHHIHPAVLRLVYRLLGLKRLLVVTDGMRSMGLPDGIYRYNGKDYRAQNGVARYLDDDTLIGSTQSLARMGRNLIDFVGISQKEVSRVCSTNQAQLLGMEDRLGKVQVGMEADLVLLNSEGSVDLTLVRGEIVYQAKA
ncbi:N-acetylglucosamine-6-phosphate deacetylase [candidate division KSB1 bacterium]|nr:N-acetylglucosamine-6-phosphate deacetylase [candidate division KSB1 bacterium]